MRSQLFDLTHAELDDCIRFAAGILRHVAPRTPTPVDDELLVVLDQFVADRAAAIETMQKPGASALRDAFKSLGEMLRELMRRVFSDRIAGQFYDWVRTFPEEPRALAAAMR